MTCKVRLAMAVTLMATLILATLSGCVEKQITEEQLMERVSAAAANIQTYELEADVTQRISGLDLTGPIDMSVTYNTLSLVDHKNQKIKTNTVLSNPNQPDVRIETYVVNDTLYMKTGDALTPGTWGKADLPQGYWQSQDIIAQQTGFLEMPGWDIISWEKINNTHSHLVEFAPNSSQILAMLQQQGIINPNLPASATGLINFPEINVRQWYDDQTYLPIRQLSQISMTMEMTPEMLGLPADSDETFNIEMDIELETNMAYSRINKTAPIRLPREAKEAIDMSASLTGSSEQAELRSTNLSVEELIAGVTAAQNQMSTFRFELIMDMIVQGEDSGEPIDMSTAMAINGAMNTPEQKMQMQIATEVPQDAQTAGAPPTVEMEMIMVENTMYIKAAGTPEMPVEWMKMVIPEDEFGEVWQSQDMATQMTDLLLDAYNIEIQGETSINGVACYQTTMKPDMAQLIEMMMQDNMIGSDTSEMYQADMIQDFTMTQWYAMDTFLPVAMKGSMSMLAEDETGEGTIDVRLSMLYYDWNESISITLPPEAENAVDMTDMMNVAGFDEVL